MRTITTLTLLCCLLACGKDEEEAVSKTLQGKAYYKNKFGADSTKIFPLALTDIYIRNTADADEAYFDKVKTDPEGTFFLENETRPITLYVKTNLTLDDGSTVPLYGKVDVTESTSGTVVIIANYDATRQNGFLLRLKDASGGLIPGGIVRVYTSADLAMLDNATAAIASLSSNNQGVVYKTNLPPGPYYINAQKKIDTVTLQRMAKLITLNASGIVEDTLLLRPFTPVVSNSLTLSIRDSLGGFIPNATILVYTSAVLSGSNDPANASINTKSDINGIFNRNNLIPGTYFINASIRTDSTIYQRLGKVINVPASGAVADSIIVRKKI
jgi:hypothetical protein